ncbi:MAG: membrane protein insertase YidC [Bdellovibrionaceae bacterium]|nr:membrane protein insertase YidC [Pseudobdellovibrionaceae bacterium]NUM59553.1 membrane protein insertase YidC [Pseudobdellovibrionaceae bacterium]
MQEQQSNPFNSRFLIAMVIFALFYFLWNNHLQKKYPSYGKKPVASSSSDTSVNTNSSAIKDPTEKSDKISEDLKAISNNNADIKNEVKAIEEKKISFENNEVAFEITNKGMGLVNYKIKNYTDSEKNPILLGQSKTRALFELKIEDNKTLDFEMIELTKGTYKGVAKIDELTIEREVKYNQENNFFENTVSINGINEKNLKKVAISLPESITAAKSKSWLFPSYEHQDFYVSHANTTTTVNFSAAKENLSQEIKTVNLLSLGSQYFATAILDKSEVIPDAFLTVNVNEAAALGQFVYPILPGKDSIVLKQILYAGPKSINILSSVNEELTNIINFGWMGFIAKPLLFTMKWFYTLVPNWGVAIILLTLLVRLFVLPFNLMSMKSMKAMQKIQPEMASIREKYKDDPIKMNQEVMNLMKVNKANPFGGCLPMLLQIPIFFALYRVIGSSIELYQSPFFLWITDLSAHDKFYVLPVLMGATMFFQQKLTPSNMDPAQAKILMWMPVVMSVFMLNLPSGLTLYMFVSGLFGITQQYFILKSKPA